MIKLIESLEKPIHKLQEKILQKRFRNQKRYSDAKRVSKLSLGDFNTKNIPANVLKKNLRSY